MWIWYPGDYEIWLGNKMNNRRTERGAFFPPFWKADSHYVLVEFSKRLSLKKSEEVMILAEGTWNVKLDGKLLFGMPERLAIPAGEHTLCVKVHNQQSPPALYVKGATIATDGTWDVTFEDKEWIDESGKASDTTATRYVKAGYGTFNERTDLPSAYRLPVRRCEPTEVSPCCKGLFYDFGRETFGFIELHGVKGKGQIHIYYGESEEEAADTESCETLDIINVEETFVTDMATLTVTPLSDTYTLPNSKAFRFVFVECDKGVSYTGLTMAREERPEEYRGRFRCSDDMLNKIWDVSAYTLHLTTREFFVDGIKRDRWTWSGDAIQSYLMNYYLFFDSEAVRRTIWLLRGKDPVTSHVNTIMDYTFYWFISIDQYYLYTGDKNFVEQIYPRMKTMMDFVLERTNDNGMVEGLPGDWVFVDWADFPMSKRGALSFEQILFYKSLRAMARSARLAGIGRDVDNYDFLADKIKGQLVPLFFDDKREAFVHNIEDGRRSDDVNKFANMFAILSDCIRDDMKQTLLRSVMLNKAIPPTTTPYMRFYEMDALCTMNEHSRVLEEMRAYWGGMLGAGATTFWEKYNPEDEGRGHLTMYGRPYGKSLCHAWGAAPVYLLGKHFLGVQPVKPGYAEYIVCPHTGGLEWLEGSVPTPFGSIDVTVRDGKVTVRSDGGRGRLIAGGKEMIIPPHETVSIALNRPSPA